MSTAYFTKKMRGYNPDEVDSFIMNLVAENEEKLCVINEELRKCRDEVISLRSRIAEASASRAEADARYAAELAEANGKYEALCAKLGEKLNIADNRAEQIIAAASAEAAEIIPKAQAQAEAILADAKAQAQAESRRILEETRTKCLSLERAAEAFAQRQREITEGLERARRSIEDGLGDIESNINSESEDTDK